MNDPWPDVLATAEDRSSGAAQIARRAADALSRLDRARIFDAVEVLIRGHPSMAPMWRLGSETLWAAVDHRSAVRRFQTLLERDEQASDVAAAILPDSVITISWSSAVLDAIRRRSPTSVACMRSEPGGEGRRTAEALREGGIAARVIDDREAVETLPGEAVLVGADAVTPSALVNKVGTDALAKAAKARRIPCYAVAGETKFLDEALPMVGPFEATPLEAFTAVATPDGMLTPGEARRHARSRPIHPDLRPLFEELGGEAG